MSRILVIDEDEPNRALVREWLCARGHQVVDLSPVEVCAGLCADVVLVDLPPRRPQALQRVREVRALLPMVTIIGLSTQLPARLSPGSRVPATLGLSRLLAKPVSREDLLLALAAVPGCAD